MHRWDDLKGNHDKSIPRRRDRRYVAEKKIKKPETGWANDPARNKAVLVEPGTGCMWLDSKGKPILGPRVTYPETPDIDLKAFVTHLETPGIEDFSPHMYRDKGGNATVGIGLHLETAREAMTLPFVEKPSMKPAHPKHIENAFWL